MKTHEAGEHGGGTVEDTARADVVARRDACETGWEQKRAELWERAEAGELLDVHHDSGGPFAVAVVR